jgi:hypothetical protein
VAFRMSDKLSVMTATRRAHIYVVVLVPQ